MVLVIAIAFVLAVAIITTGIVCLYRWVCRVSQKTPVFHLFVWLSDCNCFYHDGNYMPLPTQLTTRRGVGGGGNCIIFNAKIPYSSVKFVMKLVLWYHFRHWAQIPSDGCGLPAPLPRVQSPDGTYLASEFNYSLPRRPKGYDTIGNKHYSHDRNEQEDPRFWTNARLNREKGKEYNSDRTYKSPVC